MGDVDLFDKMRGHYRLEFDRGNGIGLCLGFASMEVL